MFNPLNLITKFIKSSNQKELDRIGKIVKTINSLEDEFKKLDDLDFPKKTQEYKEQIKQGKTLDELLPQAFALVREASKRTRNERHFDVQIIGGVVLHEGKIAEMRTGEGKTLTISLAAYLNALTEKGVHIVTVNDYLAKRDSILHAPMRGKRRRCGYARSEWPQRRDRPQGSAFSRQRRCSRSVQGSGPPRCWPCRGWQLGSAGGR